MSDYVGIREFAAELGVQRLTIARAIEAGTIPALRVGKQFRIPHAEALEALRANH